MELRLSERQSETFQELSETPGEDDEEITCFDQFHKIIRVVSPFQKTIGVLLPFHTK